MRATDPRHHRGPTRRITVLLPEPQRYDVPVCKTCKVHRDYHLEIGRALYSAPKVYIGQYLEVRADSALVKVHSRQRPGGRWTDPDDLPAEKVGYAMRDLDRLIAAARIRRPPRQHLPRTGHRRRLLPTPTTPPPSPDRPRTTSEPA